MGWRFRQSINLGGGFRINISKNGIGYSWGFPGYRYTKTADGRTRHTYSIPGTGISWVEESGRRHTSKTEYGNNFYYTENIENAQAEKMVSVGMEEILFLANRSIKLDAIADVLIVVSCILLLIERSFSLLLILSIAFKIFIRQNGVIDLYYDIDEDQLDLIEDRLDPMLRILESDCVWRIFQNNGVINVKYTSGAGTVVERTRVKTSYSPPFPFRTDNLTATFSTPKETLIFLPDKLIIMQGRNVGALDYKDVLALAKLTNFVEDERVPKDSYIVNYTWRFVNKDGGPDKRFNNNIQLPVCKYGELHLKSNNGLNTIILFSNAHLKRAGALRGYGIYIDDDYHLFLK